MAKQILFTIEVTEDTETQQRSVTVVPVTITPNSEQVLEALEECKDNEINS